MPPNPIDYIVSEMPSWLVATSARLQALRGKMDLVNMSSRAKYEDEDMEQLDDLVEQLTKMARRFAGLNNAVAEEDRRYMEEKRQQRQANSPTRARPA